jgi:peptidoglycan/LPS O-acetylase OafA/YrhL
VTNATNTRFGHIPALDGIRALSLVAILLYHSHLPWARGGFLGVTVFFTLSGFLITSLLLSEREATGRIDLPAFWARRVRRLAPAVLLLLLLVAVLIRTGELPGGAAVTGDALATAGWLANWRFVLSGQSYADLFSVATPFQHMWSLAVEEQFYLVFPVLLVLLLGRGALRVRTAAVTTALVCAASVALGAYLAHPGAVERAYYGTDTRLAEPLVGVVLALLVVRAGRVRQASRRLALGLDLAALAALAGIGVLVHRTSQYSASLYAGELVLTAVLTAVVLVAVTQSGSLLGRVLAVPPLVLLGKISYGGYVFHWPVFLWLDADRTGLSGWRLLAVRAAVTVLLAAASYVVVEHPVRTAAFLRGSVLAPAWGSATVLAVAVLVATTTTVPAHDAASSVEAGSDLSSPSRVSGVGQPAAGSAAPRQRPTSRTTTRPVARSATPTPGPSVVGQHVLPSAGPSRTPGTTHSPSAQPAAPTLRIAVVGDSLADNIGDGMLAWDDEFTGVTVKNLAQSGCPIARGGMRRWPDGYESQVHELCGWWGDPTSAKRKQFEAFDPHVVVIQDGMNELVERKLDSWDSYRRAGDPTFDTWMVDEYREALAVLNPDGDRSLLLLNAVCADWNRVSHFQGFAPELNSRVTALNVNYGKLDGEHGAVLTDFKAHLCPGGRYTDTVDGVEGGRPDGYHLSLEAATALATSWLGPLCVDGRQP